MADLDSLLALLTARKPIAEWLYDWRRPNAALTPIEIVARWCAEQLDQKTMREWGTLLGPTLKSPTDPPETADTPPLTMIEAALLAGLSANDRAVEASRSLKLLYEHVNIQSLHQAASDRLYPRGEDEVRQLAAWVRGESRQIPYMAEAEARTKALSGGDTDA